MTINLLNYAIYRAEENIDFTKDILLLNPNIHYILRVCEYGHETKRWWGFKIPMELNLDQVSTALKEFFSPNEEHYSVVVVACKDDENVLRLLCGALGA